MIRLLIGQRDTALGMYQENLKSKFMGCLVGAAVGDGLGSWREGRRRANMKALELLAGKLEQLTYTDDTHMTIGVAESLI